MPSSVPAPAAVGPEGNAECEGTGPRELAPAAEGLGGKAEKKGGLSLSTKNSRHL